MSKEGNVAILYGQMESKLAVCLYIHRGFWQQGANSETGAMKIEGKGYPVKMKAVQQVTDSLCPGRFV